jgi:ethanolamine permease
MYTSMVFSLAELSSALPHTGGPFSFARHAFGPTIGFINGVALAIEYLLALATIVFSVGTYMQALLPEVPAPVWWLLFYGIFIAINLLGAKLTFKVGLSILLLAIAILCIFYVASLSKFDPALLTNMPPDPGQSATFPKGLGGILSAIPYAIWFFLAIEVVPHASEDAQNPTRNVPKGMIIGMFTLLILAFLVLFLNSGVAPGVVGIGTSSAPLADGFKTILGEGLLTNGLILLAVSGLLASMVFMIYGYARTMFALSRAGYIPRWLSLTGKYKTPGLSLIVGGALSLECTALIAFSGSNFGGILLNMSVFAALIAYFLTMASYIKLKLSHPDLPRPYQSPLGILGALVAAMLALVAIVTCFLDAAYRPGLIGVAIFMVLMLIYFVAYSRKKLVAQAPEEQAALLSEGFEQAYRPGI